MHTTTYPPRVGEVDSRLTYVAFGTAYVFGHGSAALSRGADPILRLPGWLPVTLLLGWMVIGSVVATVAALRSQRGADAPTLLTGRLLGLAWIVGFGALALAISGIAALAGMPDLQALLWPAGSGLIVGLVYVAEGAGRRIVLHFVLGVWLALLSGASLLAGDPGLFWVLTVGGVPAFAVATVLEHRRLTRG